VSLTKIGPNHRITIPEDAVAALRLTDGDVLEGRIESGKLVLVPWKRTKKGPELSAAEQKLLARAQRKIERIRKDLATARGLTPEEANLAARAGLINPDQRWWWTEEWQRGERRTERELRAGRTKSFNSVENLIDDLHSRSDWNARISSLGISPHSPNPSNAAQRSNCGSSLTTRVTPHCGPRRWRAPRISGKEESAEATASLFR